MIDIDSKATWLEKKICTETLELFFGLFFLYGRRNTKLGGKLEDWERTVECSRENLFDQRKFMRKQREKWGKAARNSLRLRR